MKKVKAITMMLLLAAMMVACGGSKAKLNTLEQGMTAQQVLEKVGKPTATVPMPMHIEWWKYGDNQMVIMQNDTVNKVVMDVKGETEKMQKLLDDFSKKTE